MSNGQKRHVIVNGEVQIGLAFLEYTHHRRLRPIGTARLAGSNRCWPLGVGQPARGWPARPFQVLHELRLHLVGQAAVGVLRLFDGLG